MWCVTSNASFGLHRSVFENEWPLLVYVTLYASRIGAGRQPRLFQFKTPVGIMTIAALHGAFQHLVMERQLELVLGLAVTAHAELRLARFK